MNLVHRRSRVTRSTFGKLPLGALYWPAAALTGPCYVKVAFNARANGFSTDQMTTTSVGGTAAVVRVPDFMVRGE